MEEKMQRYVYQTQLTEDLYTEMKEKSIEEVDQTADFYYYKSNHHNYSIDVLRFQSCFDCLHLEYEILS